MIICESLKNAALLPTKKIMTEQVQNAKTPRSNPKMHIQETQKSGGLLIPKSNKSLVSLRSACSSRLTICDFMARRGVVVGTVDVPK
jgi:hypothetical protein